MPKDFTRDTFRASQRYIRVVEQQGRVQLDADWDEEAAQTLRYLRATPQATDTLDGIVNWWVHQRKTRSAVPRIKRALAHLVRRGLLHKLKAADGITHYRLNPLKTRPIVRYLYPAKPKRKLNRVAPRKTSSRTRSRRSPRRG